MAQGKGLPPIPKTPKAPVTKPIPAIPQKKRDYKTSTPSHLGPPRGKK